MKFVLSTLAALTILSFTSVSAVKATLYDTELKHGMHKGEVEQLEINVYFGGNFGSTITDETGTYYNINYSNYLEYWYAKYYGMDIDAFGGKEIWLTMYEDKVYTEEYQVGSRDYEFTTDTTVEDVLFDPDAGVPLYFFGTEAQITIAVTNNGPRAVTKIRVETEAFVLHTDGTNGESFGNKQVEDIEIALGETVYIDASFLADDPTLDSGLDRFSILISHPNNGGGPGNEYPALIAAYEAIFCPPEYVENLIDELGE